MSATLRGARAEDAAALYGVCLRTGADGADATGRHRDPDLLGHLWVGPFLALEPEHALVLEDGAGILGYALGTRDTRRFEAACEQRWWPALRSRYDDPGGSTDPATRRTPDQRLAHLVHHPPRSPDEVVADHPAQLHVDLLPRGQGVGHGRRLVIALLGLLAAAGAPGVHLGVGPANVRARAFYPRLGFRELAESPGVVWMGRPLP